MNWRGARDAIVTHLPPFPPKASLSPNWRKIILIQLGPIAVLPLSRLPDRVSIRRASQALGQPHHPPRRPTDRSACQHELRPTLLGEVMRSLARWRLALNVSGESRGGG